jgi:3',5'-cyclic AMP phosphodiesterase CpdA
MSPSDNRAADVVRLAHYSDIHVSARPAGWRLRDLLTKRATGWVNVRLLGRGARFRQAPEVVEALVRDVREQHVQHQVFTGDATMMGFRPEFERAARLLGVGDPDSPPGLAVPGNHDRYVAAAEAEGVFERCFADWQRGERIEGHLYPFAQQVGPYWLVALNSARPNWLAWDARGGVGPEQRQRLEALFRKLPPGPRILVTHYPIFLPTGKPEARWRRLRDWRDTLEVARVGGVCLWLHGHRHANYWLPANDVLPFPTVCAGSATQQNRWGYNVYELRGEQLTIRRRVFDPAARRFGEEAAFELTLGVTFAK